jgi:hypothetical protein
MHPRWLLPCLFLCAALAPSSAHSFCGFYVASGDARLFNKTSQVVLVRDDDRTVLTMASDFKGSVKDFALVVPVPTVLEEGQIHAGDMAAVDAIAAFTAPRLVEYFDEDPCALAERQEALSMKLGAARAPASIAQDAAAKARGVTIEARYTVGEYDILILSAKQSAGLAAWLAENGYRIPAGAPRILDTYLRQGMKFFVAKVNLGEHAKLGFQHLRPIQIAFESPKFVLPLRLGMVNADGSQEMFVYALSRKGRVEVVNYRNVRLPTDVEIPVYVKGDFQRFYAAMFDEQRKRDGLGVVFTEHAWDVSWCDPCASNPPTPGQLRELGVFWLDDAANANRRAAGGGVFVTRLHVRYDRVNFPEDLVFQDTADRTNYQARFVLRHEWKGDAMCDGAKRYRAALPGRRAEHARNLARLTGWNLGEIRERMAVNADWTAPGDAPAPWWAQIWKH